MVVSLKLDVHFIAKSSYYVIYDRKMQPIILLIFLNLQSSQNVDAGVRKVESKNVGVCVIWVKFCKCGKITKFT